MNQDLGLKVLSQIMNWSDEEARREFAWLRLMARLKYDGYRDFLAGVRLVESLVTWLQQFDANERQTAYNFIRRRLVYISPIEIQRLVESFYPRTVHEQLLRMVSKQRCIPKYLVFGNADAMQDLAVLHRKTLFMGLSDGARIDTLRHANAGVLKNDQVVVATQLDAEKWADMLSSLRKDLSQPAACFALVYLIDDFMGTGTTFIRPGKVAKQWEGKLIRFKTSVDHAIASLSAALFEPGWNLCVHHYIASHMAALDAPIRAEEARKSFADGDNVGHIHFSFGTVLPANLPVSSANGDDAFIELTQKYYDPVIETKSTSVGGKKHIGLGYGHCALPLVLEHNTPNNSVALFWAETAGGKRENGVVAPAMRPLFRRRQRFNM